MPKWRLDLNMVHIIVGFLALAGLGFISWVYINLFNAIDPTISAIAEFVWAFLFMFALVLCGGVILSGFRRRYTKEDSN